MNTPAYSPTKCKSFKHSRTSGDKFQRFPAAVMCSYRSVSGGSFYHARHAGDIGAPPLSGGAIAGLSVYDRTISGATPPSADALMA